MELFNPEILARQICASFGSSSFLKSHAPPNVEQLEQILRTAYLASMESEEGRSVKFGLILLKNDDIVANDFRVARFKEPRNLSIPEIRRLAPATNFSSTFMAIEQSDDGPRIWGAVDAGSEWTLFRRGEVSSGVMLPFILVISAAAPGSISVRFSDLLLFSAERGKVARSSSNVFKFGPIHEFFRPVLQQLVREVFPEKEKIEIDDYLLLSYGGEYLRFLVRTLQSIEEFGHGGTLIVLREDAARLHEMVSVKYETTGFEGWKEIVQSLRFIAREIRLEGVIAGSPQIDQPSFREWKEVSRENARVGQRLVELSRFLAKLTQTDGALLVTDHLRVLGFGAVIKNLSAAPSTVRSCSNEMCDSFKEEKSETYGTRHRSAMGLCRDMDCVVFVLSQDGGVKAFKSVDENVLFWPSITLDPSAWFVTNEDLIPELRKRYLSRKL